MNCGVLGGGFGLYGWLPAVISTDGLDAWTLRAYEARINQRPDLRELAGSIRWANDLDALLDRVDVLVIARRPIDQESIVAALAARGWKGGLVLEKPLARSPERAFQLVEKLATAGIDAIVGYTLCETPWASEVARALTHGHADSLSIQWRFLAHHYLMDKETWKRVVQDGGGALRFYGIHVLALLALVSTWNVVRCSAAETGQDDPCVEFELTDGQRIAAVEINTRWTGTPEFSCTVMSGELEAVHVVLADPFETNAEQHVDNAEDRRVGVARRLLARAVRGLWMTSRELREPLRLWLSLEATRANG